MNIVIKFIYESERIMFFKSNYLKENKYHKLKINLIILYLLNLSDLFFTKLLLKLEPTMFIEANVFLAPVIDGVLPYFFKIVVIAVILYYWYFRSRYSNEKEIKRSLIASIGLVSFYILINLLHLFNVGFMIFNWQY